MGIGEESRFKLSWTSGVATKARVSLLHSASIYLRGAQYGPRLTHLSAHNAPNGAPPPSSPLADNNLPKRRNLLPSRHILPRVRNYHALLSNREKYSPRPPPSRSLEEVVGSSSKNVQTLSLSLDYDGAIMSVKKERREKRRRDA